LAIVATLSAAVLQLSMNCLAWRKPAGSSLEFTFPVQVQAAYNTQISQLGPLSKSCYWYTAGFLFKTGLGATNHFESCGSIVRKEGVLNGVLTYIISYPLLCVIDGKSAFKRTWFSVA